MRHKGRIGRNFTCSLYTICTASTSSEKRLSESCVEYQSGFSDAHISKSTFSNVSAMTLSMCRVSLRKSFRRPRCFIQGFAPSAGVAFNLSSTASVTNRRRVTPCAAALHFARRKIASGISSVVFVNSMVLDLRGI